MLSQRFFQYDYEGKLIREVELPGLGSVGGFGGEKEDKELYFSFTNYNTPGSTFKYDVESGIYELYWKPNIDFNPENYTSEQVFYSSKDGTKVPMIITYKKEPNLMVKIRLFCTPTADSMLV